MSRPQGGYIGNTPQNWEPGKRPGVWKAKDIQALQKEGELSRTAWSLKSAKYRPPYKKFDVRSYETQPSCVVLDNSGTKMYVIGRQNVKILQFSLSTAWDITTATFDNVEFDIREYETSPSELAISADGDKIYFVGNQNGRLYQINLSTPTDLSTGTIGKYAPLQSVVPDIEGIYFSSSGGSLFATSRSDDSITRFDLSTNWDISTITNSFQSTRKRTVGLSTNLVLDPITRQRATLNGITQVGTPHGENRNVARTTSVWHDPTNVRPKSVSLNDDGSILFILGDNGEVYTWYLGEPFDPGTASFNRFETTNPLILDESLESPQSLYFRPNGYNFYVADASGIIAQYDLPGAYNVDKLTYDANRNLYVGNGTRDVQVSPDGRTMFVLTSDGNYRLKMYRTSRPWDFSNLITDPRDFTFSYNGEYIYICSQNTIYRHELETPWDIKTATYTGNRFQVNLSPISEGSLEGITWKPDGTKLWTCGNGQDRIYELDLSTPWDLTTIQYNLVSEPTTSETTPIDIGISTDGKVMMYAGERYIRTKLLETPWTFAGGVSDGGTTMDTRSLRGPDRYNIRSAKWSRDGKRMYITYGDGLSWDMEVHQYRVAWPFHIDNNSHDNPQGLAFSPDGSFMYTTEESDHRVFQWHLSDPYEIKSAGFVTYFQVNGTEDWRYNKSGIIYNRFPTNPKGVGLSSDGNTLFVMGNRVITQFSLTTSFYVDSVGVGTTGYYTEWDDNNMTDFCFSSDGRRLFTIGEQYQRVYEFPLKFPYDINPTTSLRHPDITSLVGLGASSAVVPTSETDIQACAISTAGNYFFISGLTNRRVYRWSLGIANSISSIDNQQPNQSYDLWIADRYKEQYPRGLTFSADGRKMYVAGNVYGGEVKQFDLSSSWSLSVSNHHGIGHTLPLGEYVKYEGHVDIADPKYGNFESQENNIINIRNTNQGTRYLRGVGIGSTGQDLYVMGYNEGQIRRYPLSTSYYVNSALRQEDLRKSTVTGDQENFEILGAYDNYYYAGVGLVTSWYWRVGFSSGGYWYGGGEDGSSQQWRGGSGSPAYTENNAWGLYVKPDGTRFYIIGPDSDRVYYYNISTSTPWNINKEADWRYSSSYLSWQDFGVDDVSTPKTGIGTTFAYLHHLEQECRAIEFKPDGTKMYITGTQSRSIWQFELEEPWNVGTANTGQEVRYYMRDSGGSGGTGFSTVGVAKSISLDLFWNNNTNAGTTLEYQPHSIRFNNDGRYLYVLGVGSDRPFVFELDEPYEIDTARYRNQKLTTRFDQGFPGIGTIEANPYGMCWSADGKHLYVVGGNNYVYDFENNIAWNTDYETDYSVQVGYGNSLYFMTNGYNDKAFPSGISTVTDVQYSPDIDRMIVVGYSNSTGSEVKQYGTGTSLGRGDYQATMALGRVSIGKSYNYRRMGQYNIRGSAFSTDGKFYYTIGYDQDRVYRYELRHPWEIDTFEGSYDPTLVGFGSTSSEGVVGMTSYSHGQEATPLGLTFSPDGKNMYIVGSNERVYQYDMPLNHYWDITRATYRRNFYVHSNSEGDEPQTVAFSTSGMRMYVATHANSWVRQYWLDTPWKVDTVQRYGDGSLNLHFAQSPKSFKWNDDGTRIFVLSDTRKEVVQYDLTVPYDVTASIERVAIAGTDGSIGLGTTGFSITDSDPNPSGLAFNNDGTKMYVVGYGSTAITQYGLSTAFNVRSATFEKSKGFYPDGLLPEEVGFNSDGTKLYVLDRKLNYLVEYQVGTAYDIDTIDLGNVGFASTALAYNTLNFDSTTAGIAVTNNNTALVQLQLASGASSWSQSAVAAGSSFGAPFTLEYRVRAQSSGSFEKMIGFTTIGDPSTYTGGNNQYNTLSHGFYHTNHNNAGGGGLSIRTKHPTNPSQNVDALSGNWRWNNDDIFRISYGTDGYVRHFVNKVEVQRVYVGAGMSYHVGAYFNTDGSMFDDIRITNTGFTTSSDGYGNAFYMYRYENTPTGFSLASNGYDLNMVGSNQDRIYRFILDETYKVGSAHSVGIDTNRGHHSDGFGYVGNMENSPQAVGFNTDGTTCYILGGQRNRLYQFTSEIKYQPFNQVEPGYYFNINWFSSPYEIKFSQDGKLMWVWESGDRLWTFRMSRPWDLTSIKGDQMDMRKYQQGGGGRNEFNDTVYTFDVKYGSEDVLYFTDRGGRAYQYPANPHWLTPTDHEVQHLGFASEGTIAYVTGIDSCGITRYNLSTPYDIGTAERDRKGSVFFTRHETEKSPLNIRERVYNPRYNASYGSNALWREANYRSLTFNYDGTKMYALGDDTDTVYQYDLERPYDTTGKVSVAGTFYVGYQDINPEAIDFKVDGTKMYMVGLNSDRIFQYNLKQPWEIVGASYDGDETRTTSPAIDFPYKSLISEDTLPREFVFNYDGTEGYMIGTQRNTVYKYSLPDAWDVETMVATATTFSVVDYERASQGLFFKPDGSEMYIVGYGTTATYTSGLTSAMVSAGIATTMGNKPGNVFQFTLASNWDITSASFTTSFYVGGQENQPTQVGFSSDGAFMLIIGKERDRMQTYTLTNPWNVDSAVYEPFNYNNWNDSQSSSDSLPQSFFFKPDGKQIFMVESNNERLQQYELSAPYQVRNLESTPRAFFFKPDGLKLYIVGSSQSRVYSFTLTEAYDVSTMYFDGGYFYIGSEVGTPTGIFFENDGLTMYLSGHSGRLHQFNLDTAWDIKSTKNYRETGSGNYLNSVAGVATTSFVINNNRGSSPYGLAFSTDRSRFWWLDGANNNNAVFEHWRQTKTGITSAYFFSRYDNYDQHPQVDRRGYVDGDSDDRLRFHMKHMYPNTPEQVAFGSDGKIMYVLSSWDDMIHQYHLPTPYRMNFYTEYPWDCGFSTDGRWFYVLGDDTKRIHQIGVAGTSGYDIVHSTYNEADYLNLDIDIENDFRTFCFKPDGTKLYAFGQQRKRLYEYTLETPWMVNTAGLGTTSFYMQRTDDDGINRSGNVPDLGESYGLRFHPDGTYMYAVDFSNYRFLQWEFGTPWDISTLGFKTDFNIQNQRYHFNSVNQQLRPRSLGFSTYGDKMFFIDGNNDHVVSFTLDTAWEVDSVGVGTTFKWMGNIENNPYALGFSTDGTKFFVAGHQRALLTQYDMGNQATAPGISSAWNVGIATTALWHGAKWIPGSSGQNGIGRSMALDGPSIAGTFTVTPWETNPRSMYFRPDGSEMWIVGTQNNYVRRFAFAKSNWDLRWSNNSSVLSASSEVWQTNHPTYGHSDCSDPTDFQFRPTDGTRMWVLSDNSNKMHQWNLKTPWRAENAQIELDFRTSAGTAVSSRTLGNPTYPQSFTWNEDGTKLYIAESYNGYIYVYDASVPYDITDLQPHYRYSNWYVGNEEYNIRGMAFATDGKKFFTVGSQDHWYVTQYDIPTQWEFSRRGISETSNTIAFHTEGTRLWMQGEWRDMIYQHDIDTPWQIGSRRMAGRHTNYAFPRVGFDSTGISTSPTVIGRGITRLKTGIQSSVYVGKDIMDLRGVSLAGGAAEGQRFFALNYDNTGRPDIIQYNLTNKWDFDGVSIGGSFQQVGMWVESNYGSSGFITERYNTDLTFSTDGNVMFIAGQEYDRVYQYYLGAAFNINTVYGDDFLGIGTTSKYFGMHGDIRSLGFNYTGTKAYLCFDNTELIQYDLHVPFDLRSGSYRMKRRDMGQYDIGHIQGIRMRDDEKVMYLMDESSDRLHHFEFTPGFEGEITHMYRSEPNEAQFYYGNDDSANYGFDISKDGKHVVLAGRQRYRVQSYDLRSPWETRTSSQSDSCMDWKYDGSKLFIANEELERIESYSIQNPADYWDLSKAGFDTGNYMTIGGPVDNNQRTRIWDQFEWRDANNTVAYQDYRWVWHQEYDNTGDKLFNWTGYGFERNEEEEVDVRQLSLGSTFQAHTGIYTGAMFGFAGAWHDRVHSLKLGINTNTGINTTTSNTGQTGNAFDLMFTGYNNPSCVAFSTDGTKMYIGDTTDDRIITYPLSTPWSVGSATTIGVAVSFYVGSPVNTVRDITFNYDGTRMYLVNSGDDRLYQYDLQTAYEVGDGSTVSIATTYVQFYNTGDGGGSDPRGMIWRPDGSQFFTVDAASDRVYQFTLATPWDITTVQNENDGVGLGTTSYYLGYQDTDIQSVVWNPEGTKLIVHGRASRYKGGDRLYEYDASVAYAVTSLSYSGYRTNDLEVYFADIESGWHWHPDGDRFYIPTTSNSAGIIEYKTTMPWSARGFHRHAVDSAGFGSEGTKMYTVSKDAYAVYEWDLQNAYEVGSGVSWSGNRFLYGPSPTGKRFYYGFEENNARTVAFSTVGDKMYVAGEDSTVYQYNLGSNWNIGDRLSGAGDTSNTLFNSTPGLYISGLNFSKDGTKVYFCKYQSQLIAQHTLSTPWDITSATTTMGATVGFGTTAFWQDGISGISTVENTPTALAFSYDGTKMYFTGHQRDTVYQYNLTTPWDITTAGVGTGAEGYEASTYIGYWSNSPWTLGFSTDGTKMFTSGSNRQRVFMQTLSTPWDVGTASTVVGMTTYMREYDSSYIGASFDELGERMFIFGDSNDMVHEFDLPNPWEVKTAFESIKCIGISTHGDKLYLSGITTAGNVGSGLHVAAGVGTYSPEVWSGINTLGILSTGILEYSMSTPWDVSSISGYYDNYNAKIFSDMSGGSAHKFKISDDGKNIFILDWRYGYLRKAGLTTEWNISNIIPQYDPSEFDSNQDLAMGGGQHNPIAFSHDGRHISRWDSSYRHWTYDLSGPWIIENTGNETDGFYFKEDGLTCWVNDRTFQKVRKYDLGEPYNLRTGIYTGHYWYYGFQSDGQHLSFKPDGTKFYLSSHSRYVSEFTMSTPWDVRTAHSNYGEWSRCDINDNVYDVKWRPDGSEFYTLGVNSISVYKVPDPWNISGPKDYVSDYYQWNGQIPNQQARGITVGAGGSMYYIVGWSSAIQYKINHNSQGISFNPDTIVRIDSSPHGCFISSEGNYMYVVGSERDWIHQFELSTNFDAGSSVYMKKSYYVGYGGGEPYGVELSPKGEYLYWIENSTNRVYQVPLRTPFMIDTADHQRTGYFKIKNQIEDTLTGFTFKPDGKKMYIVGHQRDCVFEFDLEIPWQVSTAGLNTTSRFAPNNNIGFGKSFSFQSHETNPYAVAFSTDGTYMYITGTSGDNVRGYYLETPWDVSSASIGSTLNTRKYVGEIETSPTGLAFGIGGTTMYIVGHSSDRIQQYDMSEPWNIGVATNNHKYSGRFDQQLFYDGGLRVGQQETTNPSAIGFNTDGTRFFFMGYTNDRIYQYDLNTAWDLNSTIGIGSTALLAGVEIDGDLIANNSYYIPGVRSLGVFDNIGQQYGVGFKTDGSRLYTLGISSISQYNLYANWRITNIGEIQATGMSFKPDGSTIFVLGTNERRIYKFTLTENWNLTSASIANTSSNSFYIGTFFSESNPRDLRFSIDGNSFFLTGDNLDIIYRYDMTTPWDVSTAGIAATMQTRTKNNSKSQPYGLGISTHGNRIFVTQNDGDTINEYRLHKGNYDFYIPDETRPTASFMSKDGTRLFWTGETTANVFSIDLSEPFDLTSANGNGKVFFVGGQDSAPSGLDFSPDGRRMYISGQNTGRVYVYELGDAWDVESARYNGENLDLSKYDPVINSVHVSTDGKRLFATGTSKGRVIPYDLTDV